MPGGRTSAWVLNDLGVDEGFGLDEFGGRYKLIACFDYHVDCRPPWTDSFVIEEVTM
jgi:hypothetical protein